MNKTKEQIKADMHLKAEEKRQRAFVKTVLYPYLLAHSKSISDAKAMCIVAVGAVEAAFHKQMSEAQLKLSKDKLSALGLEKALDGAKEFERDRGLLALFNDESVNTTEHLLKGMKMAIEGFEKEESTKRGLNTLKAELLD